MTRTIQILLLLLSASWVAYSTPTFNINSNDICANANCTSGTSSYSGAYPGTGESDYSGVVFKGTSDPNDSFDSAGFICTTTSPTCPNLPYASGVTITRQTDELQAFNTYRFFDTFTNNTASTISGDVNVYSNLAWITEGETALFPYSTDQSQLVVITDSASDRPAYTLVTGNNAWANANVNFYMDGRSPTDNFFVTLAPGQSISIMEFMALSATEPTAGNYVPDTAAALALGNSLLSDPYLAGLTQTQLASVVNFSFTPEPGTLGMLGAALAFGFFKLRRVSKGAQEIQ